MLAREPFVAEVGTCDNNGWPELIVVETLVPAPPPLIPAGLIVADYLGRRRFGLRVVQATSSTSP
jgi:hypothetical protein